jgi:hypothetical protein
MSQAGEGHRLHRLSESAHLYYGCSDVPGAF